jgi:hypothetical protein
MYDILPADEVKRPAYGDEVFQTFGRVEIIAILYYIG